MLSYKHRNLYMTNNSSFSNKEGLLLESLSSRKANDIVHINLTGIIKLGLLFRSYITGSIYNNIDFGDGSHFTPNKSGYKGNKSPMADESREHVAADGGIPPIVKR